MVVCAVCVSFAPIATRRMIFCFATNKKDRGRHSHRKSFCDCYISLGTYSLYRYRSLADDMDIVIWGIPRRKTYKTLLSPLWSFNSMTVILFSLLTPVSARRISASARIDRRHLCRMKNFRKYEKNGAGQYCPTPSGIILIIVVSLFLPLRHVSLRF